MKQNLLFVSALFLFAGTNAYADGWQIPTPPTGVDPTSGNQYYVMNIGSGQFLNNGKVWFSWSTTAALADDGQLSTLNETDGKWTIQRGDGKFTFISGPADGRGEMHVDGASATSWIFQKVNDAYHILVDTLDATYGAAAAYAAPKCWGWQGYAYSPVNAIIGNLDPSDAANSCEWLFMDADGYTAFKEQQSTYQNSLKCVFYSQKLKALIDDVKASYPSIDTTEELAVCNNADGSKTLKDIEDAVASIETKKKKAIAEEAEKNASVANPMDLTSMIVNSSFDVEKDFTGWSGSSFGAGGTTSTCAERYQMVFDTYQDITDMPNGVVKINVDGFYRAGSANEDIIAELKGTDYNSFVYGINQAEDADTLQAAIMHLFHNITEAGVQHVDDEGNALGSYIITHEGQTYHCPNSMKDFTNYNGTTAKVSNPYYKTNSVLIPVSEGKLRIGVKNATSKGWTIVDNFGLTYYGNGADAYALLVEDLKKNLQLAADVVCTKSMKADYDAVVAAIQAANYAEYKASVASVGAMKAEIDANVAAWKTYQTMIADCKKITEDNLYSEIAGDLAWAVMTAESNIEDLTFTTAEILEDIENLSELLAAVKRLTPKGAKISIKNYDFANGWDGWVHTGTGGNIEAKASAKCAEAWNASNFNIYQEVTNLQPGMYQIQVQGFYRYGRGDNAWGAYYNEDGSAKADKPAVPCYIYMNDGITPMAQVFDYKSLTSDSLYKGTVFYTDKLEYEDPANPGEMKTGKYSYPDDMASAGKAFDKGAYTVYAYSAMRHAGDTLRFGMKGSSNQLGDSWAIFTRFELTYQAYDAKIIGEEIDKNISKLDLTKLAENVEFEGQFVGKDIKDQIDALIARINALRAAAAPAKPGLVEQAVKDDNELFDCLAELYALVAQIDESMQLFATLHDKLSTFNDVYEGATEARQSVRTEAETLLIAANEALEAGTYTNADAEEAIKKMELLTRQLGVPGNIDAATDAQPADITGVIVNSSFEEGNLNGWTYAQGTGDTGAKDNSNATYTISNADGSYVFNTWSGSAVEGGFFVSQEIDLGLPEGTYELSVLVATDVDNKITVSANDQSFELTSTNTKEVAEEVFVVFKIAENEKITIKAASETWFKADNFQLKYYGKNSTKPLGGYTALEAIEEAATVKQVEIFSLNGTKSATLQQGVNIVRRTDVKGNVKTIKVIVR